MTNPKFIVSSAMIGFFLSCFAGFIGGAGFFIILLRATVFAAIFAFLGLGISIVFSKFLNFSEDAYTDSPENKSATVKTTGNAIDISITDEPLPVDEHEPVFHVTQSLRKYQGMNSAPDGASASTESVKETEAEKKTVSDVVATEPIVETPFAKTMPDVYETVVMPDKMESNEGKREEAVGEILSSANPGSKTETLSSKAENEKQTEKPQSSGDYGIDNLPDLTDLVDNAVSDSGDTIEDSDFAVSGDKETRSASPNARDLPKNMRDTATLAKAIETVLLSDKD